MEIANIKADNIPRLIEPVNINPAAASAINTNPQVLKIVSTPKLGISKKPAEMAANRLPVVDREKTSPLLEPAVSADCVINRIVNGPMAPRRNKLGKKSIKLDDRVPVRMSGKLTRNGSIKAASQGVSTVHMPAIRQSKNKLSELGCLSANFPPTA